MGQIQGKENMKTVKIKFIKRFIGSLKGKRSAVNQPGSIADVEETQANSLVHAGIAEFVKEKKKTKSDE